MIPSSTAAGASPAAQMPLAGTAGAQMPLPGAPTAPLGLPPGVGETLPLNQLPPGKLRRFYL